jgi:hypothetical protein
MYKRAILLDFDGVILKKNRAHNTVTQRCESFVNKYVKFSDRGALENFTAHLYKSSGHTLLGLRKMGYDIPVAEFNEFVYKPEFCADVQPSAADTLEMRIFCHEFKDFGSHSKIYISSNAPDIWCKTILSSMVDSTDLDLFETVCSSDLNALKPQEEFYMGLHERINADAYIFVDDSIVNLEPLLGPLGSFTSMSPYHYNMHAGSCAGGRITYSKYHVVNYLPDLINII